MHLFKDRDGREWTVDITVLTVERVKAACGVDLPSLFAERMAGLDTLLSDPFKLVAVIFECCRPGAEKAGLTIDSLKEAWNGETADSAIEAWLEELVGFFPDARRREALQKAIQSLRDLGTKVMERGAAMLTPEAVEAAAEQTVAAIRQQLSARESGASSGSTPATSASIPDPTLSDSST